MYDTFDGSGHGYDAGHGETGNGGLHSAADGLSHPLHVLHAIGAEDAIGDDVSADGALDLVHGPGGLETSGVYGSSHDGNVDLMMGYPDPLAHAAEFHPAEFSLDSQENGMAGDGGFIPSDGSITAAAVPYTMAADGGIMPAVASVDMFPGVENGMLTDSAGLEGIIAAGEAAGTYHIAAADEHRSEAVKEEFLHSHGYADIPAGYELHHIVPLSEGGADDVHNLLLVSGFDHQQITDAQRAFYGW